MEEFEWNGKWWLPEKPNEEISGILRFHPAEGAVLELVGSFEDHSDRKAISVEGKRQGIILGITVNGKIVTLCKCFRSHFEETVPGLSSSHFTAEWVFEGHHFHKEEDIVFESLSIQYSHLQEWVGIGGLQTIIRPSEDRHRQFEIGYIPPEIVEARTDNTTLSLNWCLHQNWDFVPGQGVIKEITLRETVFLRIEPQRSIHFEEYMSDICYHIQNFLCLAVGRAVYPLEMKGRIRSNQIGSLDGRVTHNDVSVFYQVFQQTDALPDVSKKIRRHDMLFCFRDISDDFEKCLRNWFMKSEVLRPVYDLYFGALYNPSMYMEHQFLSLTQAMESYHRRTHSGKWLSDDYYKQMRNSLIKAIPQDVCRDFRESLKLRLKYHNEFSLRKRLRKILQEYANIVDTLISDRKRFIDDVVSTRNFLTHYDKDLETKSKSGQELLTLVQKMKIILQICLLMELEIPVEKIKDLVSRNRSYQFLTRKQ